MSSEVVQQATKAIFAQFSDLPNNGDEPVMHYSHYAKLVETIPGFLTSDFTLESALSVFADNADPNRVLDEASTSIRYHQFSGLLIDMAAKRFPEEDRDIAFCMLMAMHLTRLPNLQLNPVSHRKRRTSISAPVLPSVGLPGEALLHAVEHGGALPRSSSFAQQHTTGGDTHNFFGGPYSSAIPNYGRRSSFSPSEGMSPPGSQQRGGARNVQTYGTRSMDNTAGSGGSGVSFRPSAENTGLSAHAQGGQSGPVSPARSSSPLRGLTSSQRPVYSPKPLGGSPTHAAARPPDGFAAHEYEQGGPPTVLDMGQAEAEPEYEPAILPDRVLEVARAHRLLTILDRIATRHTAGLDMKQQMRLLHVGWVALRTHAQAVRERQLRRAAEEAEKQKKQAEVAMKRAQEEAEKKRMQAEAEQKCVEEAERKKQQEQSEREKKKAAQQAEEQRRLLAAAEEEKRRLQAQAEEEAARMKAQLEAEREQRAVLAAQLEEQKAAQAASERLAGEEERRLRAEEAEIHAQAIAAMQADRQQKEAALAASKQAKAGFSPCPSLGALLLLLLLCLSTAVLAVVYAAVSINTAQGESGTCEALAAWRDVAVSRGVPLPPVLLGEASGVEGEDMHPFLALGAETGCLHVLHWQSPLCITPHACIQAVLLPEEPECAELFGCGQDHLAV